MHVEGVRYALAAAEEAGAAHVAYVSALGVTRRAGAAYAETKALAEELIVRSRIPSTIIAPSILFGEGSEIISLLRRLSALPVVPVPRISAPFRPIHVGDAARLAAEAVTAPAPPPRLPLAGPERLSFFEIVSRFLQAAGTTVVPLPPIVGAAVIRAVSVARLPGLPAELSAMLAIDNAGEAPAHADDLTRYSNWVIEAAGP
jgi:NADH dehydrogenase